MEEMGQIKMPMKAAKKEIPTAASSQVAANAIYDEPAGRRTQMATQSERIPRPSDSPLDPLNWTTMKKDVAFATLCLAVAAIDISKMMYVTVNGLIATQLGCSYVAATALTGLPIIIAALTSIGWETLSMLVGKRGIYIGAGVLSLVGMLWNMHAPNYGQFMASRVFQAVGWGAFEGLVAVSVKDMYFTDERATRLNIYHFIRLGFTWGTPILSGYVSQAVDGFDTQVMIINVIQAFSVLSLILLVPETSFCRSSPASGNATYLSSLSIMAFRGKPSKAQLMLPFMAFKAPSTMLITLMTAPLTATVLGLAATLSLIFTSMPVFLFPSHIGYLFIAPLLFALLSSSLMSFLRPSFIYPVAPALLFGTAGIFSFGLYTVQNLMPVKIQASGTVFLTEASGENLSLKIVSFLLGLAVAGSALLSTSARAYLASSPTEEKPGSGIAGASRVLEDIIQGIFIIALPAWTRMKIHEAESVSGLQGFKTTVIVTGVLVVVVGSSTAAALFMVGDRVAEKDAQAMGMDLEEDDDFVLKRMSSDTSFFEP